MKKIGFAFIALIVAFTFTASANAADTATAKFWKEKFVGGRPGAVGNVLMAVGDGFVFQNAILANVQGPWRANDLDCLGCKIKYITTYSNGQLTINPNGPCGKFKGIIPAATNISLHDQDGNLMKFVLSIPEKGVTATWINYGNNYKMHTDEYGAYVYQMGSEFDSIILTCEPPAPVFY
jgi:hypothetical protein